MTTTKPTTKPATEDPERPAPVDPWQSGPPAFWMHVERPDGSRPFWTIDTEADEKQEEPR